MSKKKLIINIVFLLVVILYIPNILQSFKEPLHTYVISDLNINYLAGFVRRGLLGEISRIFLPIINNLYFFALIFSILYFIHLILFFKLINKFENYLTIIIFLALSPSLLMFPLTHPENYMRKDIFFIISILSHSLFIYKSKLNNFSSENYYSVGMIYVRDDLRLGFFLLAIYIGCVVILVFLYGIGNVHYVC